MKNKKVRKQFEQTLFEKDFEVNGVHKVSAFYFPVLWCYNIVLDYEQSSRLPSKVASLTADQLRGK
ncbi:hypothetical protein NVP1112O_76 [Vibrio phage 1.112.O._10N.286.46.B11]|nr:hypothetical protein NVP1112O_76 [Vibrio phage 1.112.O._10N.286.46.B11]